MRDKDGHGPNWRGGRSIGKSGYVWLWMPEHPHASSGGLVLEHIVVASRALGRRLPPKSQVYHVDGDRARNVGGNLVLCESLAYRSHLQQRARALDGCGHASWRLCTHCQKWDSTENLFCNRKQAWHRECKNQYQFRSGRTSYRLPPTVPMEAPGQFVPLNPGQRGWRSSRVGWITDANGCDIWQGNRTKGYGRVRIGRQSFFVHCVRYEREIGPIPEGMDLDHYVCDNGKGGCCNPRHCRPATPRENILRSRGLASANAAKTQCPKGHPLSGDNLVQSALRRGARSCRICTNAHAYRRNHPGEAAP